MRAIETVDFKSADVIPAPRKDLELLADELRGRGYDVKNYNGCISISDSLMPVKRTYIHYKRLGIVGCRNFVWADLHTPGSIEIFIETLERCFSLASCDGIVCGRLRTVRPVEPV